MTANPLLALAEKWNARCKSAESNIGIGPDEARAMKRCAAELTALAAAHEGWQPIETAPKDGTMVLLVFRPEVELPDRAKAFGGRQFVGRWADQYTMWSFAAPVGMGGLPSDWLTHWQPVPADLVIAAATRGGG